MIYDGHAYCFSDLRGSAGYDSPEEHRRILQLGIGMHFLPARDAATRALIPGRNPIDLSQGVRTPALRDVGFRAAEHGRFIWQEDEVEHLKQVMPPSLRDMTYDAADLVAEMDHAGVDRAMLHRSPYLGIANEYIADCVRQFPDRLQGLAYVREWLIPRDPHGCLAQVRHAVTVLKLSGYQFYDAQLNVDGGGCELDDAVLHPFWDGVSELGIPVFITIGGIGTAPDQHLSAAQRLERFVGKLRRVRTWMERYPHVTVVMTHGFRWRMFRQEDRLVVPDVVYRSAPIERPNFHLQLMFPIGLAWEWEYPMPQIHDTLRETIQRIGANRLIWGSDMPTVLRHYTYRQCLDHIRNHCDFISPRDMQQLFGGTMARVMKLPS